MDHLLSKYEGNRNNNFNLIRFIAAASVLYSHSYPITGISNSDPFQSLFGITLGWVAVDVFFVTSGFLIAGSLHNRKSLRSFFWARFLRIYPGLIASLFFCVFIIGLLFTTYPLDEYLTNSETIKFLIKNSILFLGEEAKLPGVFDDTPHKQILNGSLWTLPFEVRMYLLLVIFYIFIAKTQCIVNFKFQKIFFVFISIFFFALYLSDHYYNFLPISIFDNEYARFCAMFFSGSAYYFLANHINLSTRVFILLVSILIISSFFNDLFFYVYNIFLAYIILFLAYIPSGRIRNYNKYGDYSYGIYIYAFPIQQSIVTLFQSLTLYKYMFLSFCITFVLAFLSWHLIEKKCLKLKNIF